MIIYVTGLGGYRSLEEQKELFIKAGGKWSEERGWYYPDSVPKKNQTAGKPGISWHQYGEAIDMDKTKMPSKIMQLEFTLPSNKQEILNCYGIAKTLYKGNGGVEKIGTCLQLRQ